MSACDAAGVIVAVASKLIARFTTAPDIGPISFCASATATLSPEIMTTGTPNAPAIDALIPDSGIWHAVHADLGEQSARERVRAHASGVRCRCVIADEDHGIEGRVDPFHHPERSRPRPNDGDIGGKSIEDEILAVAM